MLIIKTLPFETKTSTLYSTVIQFNFFIKFIFWPYFLKCIFAPKEVYRFEVCIHYNKFNLLILVMMYTSTVCQTTKIVCEQQFERNNSEYIKNN